MRVERRAQVVEQHLPIGTSRGRRPARLGLAPQLQELAQDSVTEYLRETADLEGLPEFVITAARAAGEEKGAGGPVVTLSRSLIVPFLQFSPRRDLREKAFRAWSARGEMGGHTDNRPALALLPTFLAIS